METANRDNTAAFTLSLLLHLGVIAAYLVSQHGTVQMAAGAAPLTLSLSAFQTAPAASPAAVSPSPRRPAPVTSPSAAPAAERPAPQPGATLAKIAPSKPDADTPLAATAPPVQSRPEPKATTAPPEAAQRPSQHDPVPQDDAPPDPKATLAVEVALDEGVSGDGGESETTAPAMQSGVVASREAAYRAALRRAIEAYKFYPRRERQLRREGSVLISFTIDRQGNISGVDIARSSGSRGIDNAAVQALVRLGRFEPIPPEIMRERWEMEIPLEYSIL